MPIRVTPPTSPVQASTESLLRKKDAQRTRALFINLLVVLALVHFLSVVIFAGAGLSGYWESWRSFMRLGVQYPPLAPVPFIALWVIYKSLELWRNPSPREIVLPPYPPRPDLRWENKIYIGSGWTRKGKQPGEVISLTDDTDELFDADNCHVILNELGLFGNIQVTGGVGSGKTSTLIQPFIYQGISKFPKPPKPETFELGSDGRYKKRRSSRSQSNKLYEFFRLWLGMRPSTTTYSGIPPELDWQPYVGMTPEEAHQEYERLMEEHRRRRWAMFILDPKGDLTEFVIRVATMCNRANDVVILRPDGESTYNPLTINANPGVQAELVMDGIEAVSGQPIQPYWRGVMAEWLENALALLRVVEPTRITFKSILRLARNESLRTQMVAEAEAIMREAQHEEEHLRRLGRQYTGVRVDPAVIEFFRDWDAEEADPQLKRAVVSGIKTQSKFFVNSELAPFLCPEMPPTFKGFDTMIDEGQIVVLRMPLDIYGPVARVLGILVMADAQQAARARINRREINQERVVAFVVDEISAYLNRSTKDFIAMNRQSRVCFLAAHQTQVQLIQHGDRGFQDSFKDNLRTKIAFSTPNADAARKEASIMGSRHVYKQTITESQSYQRVERIESDVIAPKSPEAASMSVRIDEVERYWFAPEEFMKLRRGECIIMEFDGETTRSPRRITTEAFWQTPLQQVADAQEIDLRIRKPHPVVVIGREPRDEEYLGAALMQSGYAIIQPLGTSKGVLAGFKFITDVGTVIASCEQLEALDEVVHDRLTDQQILVLFTDFESCSRYLIHKLNIRPVRLLDFVATYRHLDPTVSAVDIASLCHEVSGYNLSTPRQGSWEFHQSIDQNYDAILADSRTIINAFTFLGGMLYALSEEEFDALYDATQERLDQLEDLAVNSEPELETTDQSDDFGKENPEPSDSKDSKTADLPVAPLDDSTNLSNTISPSDLTSDYAADDDPFAADHYPDELDLLPQATGVAFSNEPAASPAPSQSNSQDSPNIVKPSVSKNKPQKPNTRHRQNLDLLDLFHDDEKDDVFGQETDLKSLQFPVDFDAALQLFDEPSDEPTAGANTHKKSSRANRPDRRRNARAISRAHHENNPQTSLNFGLSSHSSARQKNLSETPDHYPSHSDVVEGAPLD